MDLSYLFTSFDGRINRKPYWMGVLIMIGAAIVLSIVVGFIIGFTSRAYMIYSLLLQLGLLYPSAALMAKRLHDRNRPTWWIALILVPSFFQSIASVMGDPANPGAIVLGLSLIVFVIGVWFFVELGCLRGTIGPNQYGPDPLEGQQV
jgi:uncharacterized membrane protein YhaH (DUF805 family)